MKSNSTSKRPPDKTSTQPGNQAPDATKKPLPEVPDPIDEAIAESFPASDPPTFTGTTATPSQKPAHCPTREADDQNSP
ncbi:MAG: hypothetical protein WD738_10645 [Pirellulales bacterium]